MRQYWRHLLIIALPAVVGSGIAFLATTNNIPPNNLFKIILEIDLTALSFWAGILLSVATGSVIGGWLGIVRWKNRHVQQAHVEEQATARQALAQLRIEEQSAAQQALGEERQTQAAIRQRFRENLGHELGKPLDAICVQINRSIEAECFTPEQRARLESINQRVQHLQKFIKGLHQLTQLEKWEMEKVPLSLPEILEEAQAFIVSLPEYAGRMVSLNVQKVPWMAPPALGDRDLLGIAFNNLLGNAIKFSAESDQVEVRVRDEARTVVVEVADTGPGIPAEDLPHIFEELYRGENRHLAPGSGLGLAMVRRVIDLHAGEISVNSLAGKGTVFIVRLPLASAAQ